MPKIDNHVNFVKDQVAVQERLARKYDDDEYRRNIHLKAASGFADLGRFLEDIQKRGTNNVAYLNRGDTPQKRILLTFEEIENAPEELLKELNLAENDRQELLIEYLIAQAGGVLSLDKIIVQLYAKTQKVPSRATVTQRLFRMAGRGMIYNVPGKKGVYSTYELTPEEAKKMFGQFDGEASEEASPPAASPPSPAPTPRNEGVAPSSGLRKRFMSSTAGVANR